MCRSVNLPTASSEDIFLVFTPSKSDDSHVDHCSFVLLMTLDQLLGKHTKKTTIFAIFGGGQRKCLIWFVYQNAYKKCGCNGLKNSGVFGQICKRTNKD